MTARRPATLLAAFALLAGASGARAQNDEFGGYCIAQNRFYDPVDVPQGGSARGALPSGFTERDVVVDGVRSPVIDGGPRSREAVIFVHGNPGSGREWLETMRAVAEHRRVIAWDLPGWGHADKHRTLPYTLEANTDFAEGVLDQLGVERAWVGGHDIGASTAIELAVRRPTRTNGVFMLSGGIAPGYEWHYLAEIWRTPGQGELFMATFTRPMWAIGVQEGQQKPLPEEFINRTYDDFDRFTRCAVLDTYRQVDDPGAIGLRQAAAVKRFDIPALVIWGRHDPYIAPEYAEKQRLGFPSARVVVLDQAAHWPYVDEPGTVTRLITDLVRAAGTPRLLHRRLRARNRRRVNVPLSCPAAGPACSGRLVLTGPHGSPILGRGGFAIPSGGRRHASVRLRAAARRRLAGRASTVASTRFELDGRPQPVDGPRITLRRDRPPVARRASRE